MISQFDKLYNANLEASLVRDYYSEAPNRNIELMRLMGSARNLVQTLDKSGEKDYAKMKDRFIEFLNEFYNDFSADIDQEIFVALMNICKKDLNSAYLPAGINNADMQSMAQDLYSKSPLQTEKNNGLVGSGCQTVSETIKADAMYQLANEWNEIIKNKEIHLSKKQKAN